MEDRSQHRPGGMLGQPYDQGGGAHGFAGRAGQQRWWAAEPWGPGSVTQEGWRNRGQLAEFRDTHGGYIGGWLSPTPHGIHPHGTPGHPVAPCGPHAQAFGPWYMPPVLPMAALHGHHGGWQGPQSRWQGPLQGSLGTGPVEHRGTVFYSHEYNAMHWLAAHGQTGTSIESHEEDEARGEPGVEEEECVGQDVVDMAELTGWHPTANPAEQTPVLQGAPTGTQPLHQMSSTAEVDKIAMPQAGAPVGDAPVGARGPLAPRDAGTKAPAPPTPPHPCSSMPGHGRGGGGRRLGFWKEV